jgi:hypothetical protein
MRNALRLWLCLSLVSAVGLAACGDDGADSGTDAGVEDAGAPIGEDITASEGGTVEVDGAKLDIPAGALSEDTEITVQEISKAGLPDAANIASTVYELGPDGTQFATPVTLSFAFDPSSTPEGKEAVLAWLDGDAWSALTDSQVDGETVAATTRHFSVFAVIWKSTGQVGGTCDDLDFEPCGGDLVGLWEITIGCANLAADATDPLPSCDGDSVSLSVDLTGAIELNADMSYTSTNDVVQETTAILPKSCLMGASCDQIADEGEPPFEDTGDACERTTTGATANTETGTYVVDGNTVTLTEEGQEPQAADEYCVQGNMLTVRHVDEDGNEVYFRAIRD